jgi:phosphate-selective porin OprO/OprP
VRGFLTPFKNAGIEPLEKASLGIAMTYGWQDDGDNLSVVNFRTPGMATFFRYRTSTSSTSPISVVADGRRYRLSPQGYYYYGPFGLMGEYIYSEQDALRTATSDDVTTMTKASIANDGWFVQASYVLTGEDASYKQVVPINAFDPANGRWGAFEVAFRASGLDVEEDLITKGFTAPGQATSSALAYTGGLNWYLNKNFKFQLNYNRTRFNRKIEIDDELFKGVDSFILQFQMSY